MSLTHSYQRSSNLFQQRHRRFTAFGRRPKPSRCPMCITSMLEASKGKAWANGCRSVRRCKNTTRGLECCRALQFRNISVVSTMLSVLTEEVVEEGDLEITSSKIEFSRRFWEVGFVKDNVESAHDLAAELAQAAAELGTVGKELRSMRRHGQSRRPPLGPRTGQKSPYRVFPIPKKLNFEAAAGVSESEMKSTSAELGRRRKALPQTGSQPEIRAPQQTTDSGRYAVWDSRIVQLLEQMNGPLLSAEEELKYGMIVQKCMRLQNREEELEKEIGREPSVEECARDMKMSRSVYKKIRMAGSEARKMLQQRNIRLVVSVARRYQMLSSDIADLVSDGMVGLDRAIDKFDPTRGFRFSTYAHWWIRQAVMRGQTEESRVVRLDDEKLDHLIALGVPVHVLDLVAKIRRTKENLESEGKISDEVAISEETGLSVKRIRKLNTAVKKTVHLDSPLYGEASGCLTHEIVEDPRAGAIDTTTAKESLQNELESVLDTLYPRERNILRLRYGLDDGKVRTLVEIGEFLNITRERVRQIEMKAVRKLRNPERCRSLLDYRNRSGNSQMYEDVLLSLQQASQKM